MQKLNNWKFVYLLSLSIQLTNLSICRSYRATLAASFNRSLVYYDNLCHTLCGLHSPLSMCNLFKLQLQQITLNKLPQLPSPLPTAQHTTRVRSNWDSHSNSLHFCVVIIFSSQTRTRTRLHCCRPCHVPATQSPFPFSLLPLLCTPL